MFYLVLFIRLFKSVIDKTIGTEVSNQIASYNIAFVDNFVNNSDVILAGIDFKTNINR